MPVHKRSERSFFIKRLPRHAPCHAWHVLAPRLPRERAIRHDALRQPNQLEQLARVLVREGRFERDEDAYDAFGLIRTTFRELGWKTLIFFEGANPDKSKRCYDAFGGFGTSFQQLG